MPSGEFVRVAATTWKKIMTIRATTFCLCFGAALVASALALPAAAQSHGGSRGSSGAHASGGHAGGYGRAGNDGQRGGGWRGGGGWQRGGPGWWGVGLGLGLGWGVPYYGGYPGYYGQYDPQVVVEQGPQYQVQPVAPLPGAVAPGNGQAPSTWYYCDSSRAYYPYVSQCAEGWRAVPAVPPGAGH